jgi:translation initiation factor IF-2
MEQLRVVDLAHTMGITPTELIFKLRSIGVSVAGEEDTLDLSTVRSIITGETLQKRPREVIVRTEPREDDSAATSARDRMVKRRRRQVIETEKEIREFVSDSPGIDATTAEFDEAPVTDAEMSEVEAVTEPEEPTPEIKIGAEVEVKAEVEVDENGVAVKTEVAATGPPGPADAEAAPEFEEEVKPRPEVTEEELTAERNLQEEPTRIRPVRAKTPLEQSLRELSPDEIKEHLVAQRVAEKKRKEVKPTGGRKAKAAADAQEIRELLSKFEEQKLKSQESGGQPSRPAHRPGPQRPGRRGGRRRSQQEERPAPPRPSRTLQFKDGLKPEGPIILSEMVTSRELAEKLNITAKDLLGLLIQKGVMVTTNQALPHELAEEICSDVGVDAMVASAEEVIEYEREESDEPAGPALPRPPIVTVMGHVDHGKTSLLDAIRVSRVAEHEAGGITQHVGASRIETSDGRRVVFIDTPGHEAFTQMRARGAQVTDIVVLVVAADDGVMPQTEEAIAHARAGNVPIIVAVNKIDKANANPDRIKQQLAERNILVEDWGGDVPSVQVSAKTMDGIGDLLDMILLVAELKDLKATAEGPARGVVLEARKEKGRGIVATVIIQQGTLNVGDYYFCGSTWGRVRAIADDAGNRTNEAGPSDPVEVMGFAAVPKAGDVFQGTESEDKALEVATFRSNREKEEGLISNRKVSLDNLFDHIAASDVKELNIVVKADVQGSVEVLRETLGMLSTEKVKINVLHASVGAVTTNDVLLATASNTIIIGFSVRPERTAKELAEAEQVEIRLYTVIYELIDDIKKSMLGMLDPVFREEELGRAEVREVFRIPKVGAIAGSHVVDGVINRKAKARLLRDNVVVYEGQIASLRHFKDEASEARKGTECGISLERYQDVKEGDVIEAYHLVEETPEL